MKTLEALVVCAGKVRQCVALVVYSTNYVNCKARKLYPFMMKET